MKRILFPSLLSVAYLALLVAFFSTDFSKRHSFLASPLPATSLERIERPSVPALRQVVVPETAARPALPPGGESPESAGK
jgi:hypothetical protein